MRIKILLAYDGGYYYGWQIQEKQNPPPTIQGAVEAALFNLYKQKIRIYGSGRTDAGVHAIGQVAHFDLSDTASPLIPLSKLAKALNCFLRPHIRILQLDRASPYFHARNDAVAKTYIYNLWPGKQEITHDSDLISFNFCPPYLATHFWECGDIDILKMREGAKMFEGWHDFGAFQNSGTPVKSTFRKIIACDVAGNNQMPFYGESSNLTNRIAPVSITITANGFLKQMARNIVGALVGLAQNKIGFKDLEKCFNNPDRRTLVMSTAPSHGLVLAHVFYKKS